jgi:hypothetical protein
MKWNLVGSIYGRSSIKIAHVIQSLLFLLNAAFLAEKQQIPILYSFVWQDRSFVTTIYRTRGRHANHYATDAVPYFYFIFIILLIKISYCIQNGLCRIGIRQFTFDRMVMILYRTYNSFSLFAMQLDYCNIQSVWTKVGTLTVYIDIK